MKVSAPRNTRLNEIFAIALLATSALITLCLASYNPDDPSWNAAGQTLKARNLVGTIGANVAAGLYQIFGLAAGLLPLMLLVAAWRRFRTRRIRAPLSRVAGLVMLVLAVSALLALSDVPSLFDASVRPGGLVGTLLASALASGLNRAGAGILLAAAAATGLLLTTNFSFARAYEQVASSFNNRFGFLRALPERFSEWRARRRAEAHLSAEMRREARVQREQASEEKGKLGERAADAGETIPDEGRVSATAAIRRAAGAADVHSPAAEAALRAQLERAEAELAAIVVQTSSEPHIRDEGGPATTNRQERTTTAAAQTAKSTSAEASAGVKRAAEIAEMVRAASVVRTESEDAEAETRRHATIAERARAAERKAAALSDYKIPTVEFLNAAPPRHEQAEEELRNLATRVAERCKEFNVTGKIEYICPGPVVTTYEFKPDPGVKYSRVTGLVDDLCLALKAESIRIDRVPGKAHVGIEVPNPERETIFMREVIESRAFGESPSKLTLALGKTIDGMNYVADLTRMPHLLIAGATGTGKSVCLNSLVVSILYKARPDEVKFIMIDPKRLELGLYADIPHLATPIITDPKRAANSLKWAVVQMEKRYKDLAGWGVRNIDGFNAEVMRRNLVEDFDGEGQPWKPLPYIVIIIDELADLMMVSGHEVEEAITRLAQMARAVGIHLVLATQRPSVDVITGLIKANFPSRIAFRVSSKVDSRTIIDANGAEQLLGRGDMLFLPPGTSRLVRVHGAYLDEVEINRIVEHIKGQGQPVYDETITLSEEEATGGDSAEGVRDELFEQALRICVEMKRASTSVLQRRLRIGYGRAAAILDAMEREGFIGQADGSSRPRPVLGRAFETIEQWDHLENDA